MNLIKTDAGDDLRIIFDLGPFPRTTSADVWAAEFVRLHGGDEGLMLSWFANAIEAGRDAGRRILELHRPHDAEATIHKDSIA